MLACLVSCGTALLAPPPEEPEPEPPVHDKAVAETQRSAVAEMPAYGRPMRPVQQEVSDDRESLRETIPIPILPKLARYV